MKFYCSPKSSGRINRTIIIVMDFKYLFNRDNIGEVTLYFKSYYRTIESNVLYRYIFNLWSDEKLD